MTIVKVEENPLLKSKLALKHPCGLFKTLLISSQNRVWFPKTSTDSMELLILSSRFALEKSKNALKTLFQNYSNSPHFCCSKHDKLIQYIFEFLVGFSNLFSSQEAPNTIKTLIVRIRLHFFYFLPDLFNQKSIVYL